MRRHEAVYRRVCKVDVDEQEGEFDGGSNEVDLLLPNPSVRASSEAGLSFIRATMFSITTRNFITVSITTLAIKTLSSC